MPYNYPTDLLMLDDLLLDTNKRIKLLDSKVYREIDLPLFRLWCTKEARYGIPTTELIEWLTKEIGEDSALEIGAGNGDLGWHLGIPATDSYCQQRPEIKTYYWALNQVPTTPTPEVKKLEALEAIDVYQPAVVVGSWITQKYREGDLFGSVYGVEEEKVLSKVKKYIHIGNAAVHGQKAILKRSHKKYYFPWLVSKSGNQEENVIYVFEGGKS